MLCKRGLCRHAVSVSVCVSVTFVNSVKTNKHIYKIFTSSGSQTILVFFYTKGHGNILTETLVTGASNAGGVGRNAIPSLYLASLRDVNAATGQVLSIRRRQTAVP